jgi:SNF family Na+-dependent transporter
VSPVSFTAFFWVSYGFLLHFCNLPTIQYHLCKHSSQTSCYVWFLYFWFACLWSLVLVLNRAHDCRFRRFS